jgi:hypothetical protein
VGEAADTPSPWRTLNRRSDFVVACEPSVASNRDCLLQFGIRRLGCEVEQRPRWSAQRQAVPNSDVATVQARDAVQSEAVPSAPVLADHGQCDLRGWGIEQTPGSGRTPVAEHRVSPEMEDRGHLLAERLDRDAVHEVHPSVPLAKPTGAEAVDDCPATESSC